VPGILLNVLLIYLVKRCSRSELGTFRYLLIIFAGYDIILIVLNLIFDPKYIVLPGIFSSVLDFPLGAPMLTLIHGTSFMISYAILIMHILYRYWVIHEVVACHSVLSPEDSVGTLMIREEFRGKFGRDISAGWVVVEYWKNGGWNLASIAAAATVDAAGLFIVVAVVSLASMTYHRISISYGLSTSTKAAQMRLLLTVCVQTVIPIVCVAIPYFCNTTLPIFSVTLPFVSESTAICMSLFSSCDPLAVILLMKPYRTGLKSLVTLRKKSSMVVPISPRSTEA
ncbi:hypothetical protein PMAYCL1PPCAC_15859, partial [Pristionchus mayeri]